MVLAEFWFAFLAEGRAVAGGLGLYSVSGQPGNLFRFSRFLPVVLY